jgi:hypothetical protein
VKDAVWLGGSALVVAGSALGWLDPRLLVPFALLALIYGVLVIRRLRDDPVADDLNARSVAFASGGLEASENTSGRGHVYYLSVRPIDAPYKGYRQFKVGRQVFDRLPHPTDAQRKQIGPHRGVYTPSVTCRAYYLPRSSRLLSVDLIDPTHE